MNNEDEAACREIVQAIAHLVNDQRTCEAVDLFQEAARQVSRWSWLDRPYAARERTSVDNAAIINTHYSAVQRDA